MSISCPARLLCSNEWTEGEFLPDLAVLDEKAIAPSLEGFSFSGDALGFDASNFLNATYEDDDDDDTGDVFSGNASGVPMDVDGGFEGDADRAATQDFFAGDQAVGDDYGGGFDMGPDDGPPMDDDSGGYEENGGLPQQARIGGFEPFDPRRAPNERDLVLAMTEPGANGSSLDYFDQTFLKNWAGPEHWKLRKVIRRRKCPRLALPFFRFLMDAYSGC